MNSLLVRVDRCDDALKDAPIPKGDTVRLLNKSMNGFDVWRKFAILIVVTAAAACGGGDDDTTGPTPTPAIGISVSPTSLSLPQGANGSVTATVSRSGGFAGNIDLSLEGAPTGVTASFSPASVAAGATTSTITITAAASTAPGNYTLTLRAKGTGATDQTASVALTVTAVATGSYTMAVSPASVSVTQGAAAGSATVTVTRTGGFTGAVALTTSGAPTGLTVTANPTSIPGTATTSALSISAASNTAPGTYTITVNGAATGVTNQSATFSVVVTAPSSGNASWQFCASNAPLWFAVQDGTGAWTRVTPTNNAFGFNITSSKGGVAYVQAGSGSSFTLTVLYGLKQELTDAGAGLCANTTEKTVNGSVAGLGSGEAASVSLGGALATVSANGNFTLNNVPDGPRDLVAARTATTVSGTGITFAVNKLIIRRALNQAANSTMPALDFNASEAVAPVSRNVTVNGAGSDFLSTSVSYVTANNAITTLYTDALSSGATRAYYGVPAASQATGDLHLLTAVATNVSGSTANYLRIFGTYFKDATDKTVTLGPVPATATVSVLGTTPYVRLRMQWTAQTEYGKYFSAIYSQSNAAAPRTAIVSATSGYLGSTSVDLAIPDFTGVAGWDSNWGLKAGQATQWVATGTSWSSTGGVIGSPATEGGTLQIGSRIGTITP